MKNISPLVLALLIITLTACNKDDSPTAPVVTTAETTKATTSTEPPTTTPPTTTTTTAVTTTEPPETTTATTTTPAPTTQPPTPTATNPPPTQAPPPPTTTTATTEPPVAFDPQVYVDYAIWYGQSIGLRYGRELVGDGGDNPRENAAWDTPMVLTSALTDEQMKRNIRDGLDFIKYEGFRSFYVEAIHNDELGWLVPYRVDTWQFFMYRG